VRPSVVIEICSVLRPLFFAETSTGAQERREREQREHPTSERDVAIVSPAPIPDEWRN
jgi:hypothetical protein